jgi:HlyD family secretion protein
MTAATASSSFVSRSRARKLVGPIVIGAGVLLAVILAWMLLKPGQKGEPYRTEAVSRGEIVRTVSASGSLEALNTVQVGSQLSGQVTQVLVDYNDHVRKGQVLAILDPQTQRSAVEQAAASVAASAAGVGNQQAALQQAQAEVALAQADYDRQKFLFDKGIVAQAALDTANAKLKTARAGVAQANAQIRTARAQVSQQQAALRSNQANLNRTTIVAPIDGIVIDRQIEPGQTVASGLNVAVLFTLAQDLGRVQALIRVDEADIGSVRVGQTVRFTVDAFPNDSFTGVVTEVRKLPTTESNVVAYTVVAEAANPGEKLLPGMTANADILLERRPNVLRVPNSALRFTPAGVEKASGRQGAQGASPFGGPGGPGGGNRNQNRGNMAARIVEELNLDAGQKAKVEPILAAAQQKARAAGGGASSGQGQGRGRNPARAAAFNEAFDKIKPLLRPDQQTILETLRSRFAGGGQRGTVWILRNNKPVQVSVRTGATDGSYTEVTGGRLRAGDLVITGGGPRPKPSARDQQQATRRAGGAGGGFAGPR